MPRMHVHTINLMLPNITVMMLHMLGLGPNILYLQIYTGIEFLQFNKSVMQMHTVTYTSASLLLKFNCYAATGVCDQIGFTMGHFEL